VTIPRHSLPTSYKAECRRTRRNPITADYALWLVLEHGSRPSVVPADFPTKHLEQLPADERVRWLRTARRRHNARKRRNSQ